MSSELTFHPFDGGAPMRVWSHNYAPFDVLVERLAADAMSANWEFDERAPFDRAFQAECDRYALVEMFAGDDDYIEVVTFDGKPIGVLDRADIGLGDLARFETYEQLKSREAAEDAARELHAELNRELRRAAE